MTLVELRYIVALAKYKHFTRAAEACNVSQPTLSVAINKLESNLGVHLFERQSNAIRITELGEQIVAQAVRTLEEAQKIKEIAQAGQSQLTTPLRLGAIYSVAPYLFPKLIPELQKQAPDLPLIIQENFTHELAESLQRGELDVIIVALPFNRSGVLTKTLYREAFVCLLNTNHPLAHQQTIARDDLSDENVLLLGKGHCFRDQVIDSCPQCYQHTSLQDMIEGSSLETLRHMVASGVGMTILPEHAANTEYYTDKLCVRRFRGKEPYREIAIAWRVSFPRPKLIDVIERALQSVM